MADEFVEREGVAPDREAVRTQEHVSFMEVEELRRRANEANSKLERLIEEHDKLTKAYALVGRAWTLAKAVIAERFGEVTGNLVRQGIETQVERELGASPPPE